MKTSELTGAALDWAVAKITNPEWWEDGYMENDPMAALDMDDGTAYSPSINWEQGGPIIEREKLSVGTRHTNEQIHHDADVLCWARTSSGGYLKYGPTPLIAAMRCFVASRLGDEVDVPEELCQ